MCTTYRDFSGQKRVDGRNYIQTYLQQAEWKKELIYTVSVSRYLVKENTFLRLFSSVARRYKVVEDSIGEHVLFEISSTERDIKRLNFYGDKVKILKRRRK